MVNASIIIVIIILIIILIGSPLGGYFVYRYRREKIIENVLAQYKTNRFIEGGKDIENPPTFFDKKKFYIINPLVNNQYSRRFLSSSIKGGNNVFGSGNAIGVNQIMWLNKDGNKALLMSVEGVYVVEQDVTLPDVVNVLTSIVQPTKTFSSNAFILISNTNQLVIYDRKTEDDEYSVKYINSRNTDVDKNKLSYYYTYIDGNNLAVRNWDGKLDKDKDLFDSPNKETGLIFLDTDKRPLVYTTSQNPLNIVE